MAGNSFNDFSMLKALKKELEKKEITPATEEKPVITGRAVEIDLHIEALPGGLGVAKGQELPYQMDYFRSILQSRLKHRGSRIIFIHGAGDGILKAAIREELDTVYAISCSWNPYGDGATAVTIK